MCRLRVACRPWIDHTCMLSVFVSAPSPLCQFLGVMSFSCARILGYSGPRMMLSKVFIWFAEFLLSTHQFGFSFHGLNICDECVLLILSRTFFQFADLFLCVPDFLLWVLVWILLQICTFFFPCLLSFLTENVTLSWRILPLSTSMPRQVWSRDFGMRHAACFLTFYKCLRCDMHIFCFGHLIWLSEGTVFWLISLLLEAQSPGPLNRRK